MDNKELAKIYYLTGGARSGKSQYAEELAGLISKKVGYFATGQVIDEEMKKRVELHQKRRPKNWITFELDDNAVSIEGFKVIAENAKKSGTEVLVIDCITNLLFRLIYKFGLDDIEILDNELEQKIEDSVNDFFNNFIKVLKKELKEQNMSVILVTNEVGMGLVPSYSFGRVFRDMLGQVNKMIAGIADEAYFFVSGLSMKIK